MCAVPPPTFAPHRALTRNPRSQDQRNHLFDNDETSNDISEGLRYIADHPEINNVLLTGGINDSADVLAELYQRRSYIGCPPYYLFQGRPTAGNEPYAVPIVRGWKTFQEALHRGSGLARRTRFCMSHERGKVEVVAIDDRLIYLKFHQAKDPSDVGKFFVCHRDDEAMWLDDLKPVATADMLE